MAQHEQTQAQEFEAERLDLEPLCSRVGQAAPKQIAAHHGLDRQEALRSQRITAPPPINLFGQQCIVEPEDDCPIADSARKGDAVRCI